MTDEQFDITTYRIHRNYRRFFWPHPYAREAGRLWRKLTVGFQYEIGK